MVHISDTLRNIAQLMLFKTTQFGKNHKKKLIFAVVLLALGYIAKKKLTIEHAISFAQTVSKIFEMLPLPEAPKLRPLTQYSHQPTPPLKTILEAINLQQIKRKITNRQASWEQLKQSIVTGTVLTLSLYNVNTLYFQIQNKYSSDFLELNASTQFDKAMHHIRKCFTQEIPNIFQQTKVLLADQLDRIELMKIYEATELTDIFRRLVDQLFDARFDLSKQEVFTSIKKVSPSTLNRFTTPYEYVPQKKSIFRTVAGDLLGVIGSVLSVGSWFPQPVLQVTTERYQMARSAYVLPLKKAGFQPQRGEQKIEWPNKQSEELFGLFVEQLQSSLQSLNFSILLKAYTQYNIKILRNRIRLLLNLKKKDSIKFSQFLPLLYKILQEEFLKQDQYQCREKYHNLQVKKALKLTAAPQIIEAPKGHVLGDSGILLIQERRISLQQEVLQQIEMKNEFLYLQKEFQMKLYNERSGVVIRPRQGEQVHESEDIQRFLNMVSGAEGLSNQE